MGKVGRLTLDIEEGTVCQADEDTYRMHFYESSLRTPQHGRLLTICCRAGGMRATEEQARELHEWLGKWLGES